jgi:hypothetical protein
MPKAAMPSSTSHDDPPKRPARHITKIHHVLEHAIRPTKGKFFVKATIIKPDRLKVTALRLALPTA